MNMILRQQSKAVLITVLAIDFKNISSELRLNVVGARAGCALRVLEDLPFFVADRLGLDRGEGAEEVQALALGLLNIDVVPADAGRLDFIRALHWVSKNRGVLRLKMHFSSFLFWLSRYWPLGVSVQWKLYWPGPGTTSACACRGFWRME